MKHAITLSLLIFFAGALAAQPDSLLVTKNFKFRDGVYLDFADFQQDKPTYTLDELDGKLVNNVDQYITKIETLGIKGGGQDRQIDINRMWGISIGGIPYIRVRTGRENGFATFAALRVRGKLCYYAYDEDSIELVQVSAYNPKNGRPFRTAKVPKTNTFKREMLLDFQTGEKLEFNQQNFLKRIDDDPQLQETVRQLSEEDAAEKRFKCLLIYVDRNPVYLTANGGR